MNIINLIFTNKNTAYKKWKENSVTNKTKFWVKNQIHNRIFFSVFDVTKIDPLI